VPLELQGRDQGRDPLQADREQHDDERDDAGISAKRMTKKNTDEESPEYLLSRAGEKTRPAGAIRTVGPVVRERPLTCLTLWVFPGCSRLTVPPLCEEKDVCYLHRLTPEPAIQPDRKP